MVRSGSIPSEQLEAKNIAQLKIFSPMIHRSVSTAPPSRHDSSEISAAWNRRLEIPVTSPCKDGL